MPSLSPTPQEPNRISLDVVVLGGGFAGVYCGRKLSKTIRKIGKTRENVGIVSNQNYMVFQPMLAEVAGASLSPRHVINPIRLLCRNISVFKGDILRVDLEKKEVHVNTGSFSSGVIIEFQHLVLALGAEIDLSRVPGMPEHALLMQNVGDAMILRATIISRIEEANIEQREEVRKRLLTFVVVGGGYSGVETAGEMLDMLRGIAKYYQRINPAEIRVILVHSRDRVLNNLSIPLGEYAGRKLAKRGLELVLEERVGAVTASKVYLQSGTVIETNTVVSTVGNAPNRVIRELCDSTEIEHERYWIKTDANMRVPGYDFLWAAGDCAAVPFPGGEEGERCPQTAQFAMRQGERLAENIVDHMRDREMKPFTFKGLGELASIGHHTAVANIMGMQFSGFIAWFMWRSIYLSKLPGLDRKLRVMIDWTLDIFFPRDINLLNPRYTSLFRKVHLEPNDVLFNRGDPAFSLYVVKSGQIDLRDQNGQTVRTIEPGDYFGERALVHKSAYLYDAIALEQTELFSLSGSLVLPFFKTSTRLRRILGKTTTQGSAEGELKAVSEKLNTKLLSQTVSEVMHSNLATLRAENSVEDLLTLFKTRRFSIYPIVSDDGKLTGGLSREDFFDYIKREEITRNSTLQGVELVHLPICRPDETVEQALEKMIRSGRYKCFVTDEEMNLLGILTVMDLFGEAVEQAV